MCKFLWPAITTSKHCLFENRRVSHGPKIWQVAESCWLWLKPAESTHGIFRLTRDPPFQEREAQGCASCGSTAPAPSYVKQLPYMWNSCVRYCPAESDRCKPCETAITGCPVSVILSMDFFFARCCLGKVPGRAPFSQLHKGDKQSRMDRP